MVGYVYTITAISNIRYTLLIHRPNTITLDYVNRKKKKNENSKTEIGMNIANPLVYPLIRIQIKMGRIYNHFRFLYAMKTDMGPTMTKSMRPI